jgi:hypothetical protein
MERKKRVWNGGSLKKSDGGKDRVEKEKNEDKEWKKLKKSGGGRERKTAEQGE